MNTFYAMWGTKTPQEVKDKIAEQTADMKDVEPKNLEEQAIKLIGPDIYEKLIKGYTEIITLTTVTKGFQSVVTMSSLKTCWVM